MKVQCSKKTQIQISTAGSVFLLEDFPMVSFTCKDYMNLIAMLAKLVYLTLMCIQIQFMVVKFSTTSLKLFNTITLIIYGIMNG